MFVTFEYTFVLSFSGIELSNWILPNAVEPGFISRQWRLWVCSEATVHAEWYVDVDPLRFLAIVFSFLILKCMKSLYMPLNTLNLLNCVVSK